MSDAALENANARRADAIERLTSLSNEINELVNKHNALRNELTDVEQFIRMWHTMVGIQVPPGMEQREPTKPDKEQRRIRPTNPARELVASNCANYIRDVGRPLGRAELLQKLTADDIVINGKDPAMVLSTMLWRSKDVVIRLPKGGYWLAGKPVPSENSIEELFD